jgi:hypothetical protein
MKLVFENALPKDPDVSIVLLDWSVRESFHVLDYLSTQTVPKERYEIIWIEYYNRRAEEITQRLKTGVGQGKPPIIDTWVVMDMPHTLYYHKHLMYNVGIVVSRGNIVTFMDSDAVVGPGFVEAIIQSFTENSGIVLHMDQVRNINRKFYPFNYPALEEIAAEGCANFVNGKPRGLIDKSDPLHLPNYGACMSARRDDLILMGGADEQRDYLGHMCGPYDMTFRLLNAGKKEIWHQDEWLYHTWHPGQAGDKNYGGPHDGRHMAQAALCARRRGEIFPRVENPAIKKLRLKRDVSRDILLSLVVSEENTKEWSIDERTVNTAGHSHGFSSIDEKGRKKSSIMRGLMVPLGNPLAGARLYAFAAEIILGHVLTNIPPAIKKGLNRSGSGGHDSGADQAEQTNNMPGFLHRMFGFLIGPLNWHEYVIDRCWHCLNDLRNMGINEIAVFCSGYPAKVLCAISKDMHIRITAIYDISVEKTKFMGHNLIPVVDIGDYTGPVIIASFEDVIEKTELLKERGVAPEMVVDLW